VRGRVEFLENSYAKILELLANRNESQENSWPRQSEPQSSDVTRAAPETEVTQRQIREEVGAILDDGLEASLTTYRRMANTQFPFIIVPEECSAKILRQKRPMLARAIAVATAWKSPNEQAVRRALFLKELSTKYFVKNERSLDLLQAMIVHFLW
jgi:hypothetical protein